MEIEISHQCRIWSIKDARTKTARCLGEQDGNAVFWKADDLSERQRHPIFKGFQVEDTPLRRVACERTGGPHGSHVRIIIWTELSLQYQGDMGEAGLPRGPPRASQQTLAPHTVLRSIFAILRGCGHGYAAVIPACESMWSFGVLCAAWLVPLLFLRGSEAALGEVRGKSISCGQKRPKSLPSNLGRSGGDTRARHI